MKPLRALLAGLLLLLLAWPVQAQSQAEKRTLAERMLEALRAAPNEELSSRVEERLLQTWLEFGTPAVTLLMSRGLRDLSAGSHDDAISVFSDAILLDPTLAEAFHQRAIAKYQAGDTAGAVRDIEETLKREPRNFAAFRTLTEIAAAREDWKGAYAAWEKLLAIAPKTRGGESRLKELKRKAFGEDA